MKSTEAKSDTFGVFTGRLEAKASLSEVKNKFGDLDFARASLKNILPQRLFKTIDFIHSLIADDLRITLAAQVFTIPLILFTFHRISLVSPLTNILIGFIIPPLTALGLFVAILGWIFLPLGQVAAWICWVMLQYLIIVVEWTAKIPLASIGW